MRGLSSDALHVRLMAGPTGFGGPMFEGADNGPWRSIHRKAGAHYNTYACATPDNGMEALREFFPDGPDSMNFVLFSTSGVHGTYATIEDAEGALARGGKDAEGDDWTPEVTFLVVQPRIVCLRYGTCRPTSVDDIVFLKQLRAASWKVVPMIGEGE